MNRNLWQSALLFVAAMTLMVGVTTTSGCGIAQELKDDTNAVLGENGLSDEYLDTVNMVCKSHLAIVKAFSAANPDATELTVEAESGETYLVSIADYIKALDILIAYPDKLKKAYHALNRAIQTNNGISGFWEQFLRTLEGDKIGELFKAIG